MDYPHHPWLDLALIAPWMRSVETTSALREALWPTPDKRNEAPRLTTRLKGIREESHLDLERLYLRDLATLWKYAEALGAWAVATPSLADWMSEDLLTALRALSPDTGSDPLSWAQAIGTQYLLESDARLVMQAQYMDGTLSFAVAPSHWHQATTDQWFRYTIRPYKVRQCTYCELTYTPERGTSKFCSGACRQSAHREKLANG